MSNPATPKRAADPHFTFRLSALWTAIGTYLPGLGLVKANRKKAIGVAALALFIAIVAVFGIWAAVDLNSLISLFIRPSSLMFFVIALPIIALVWLAVIVVTNLEIRPTHLTGKQRALGSALVGVLCFSIAAPLAVGARYAWDQRHLVNTVFQRGDDIKSGTAPDMSAWKDKPRVNILLLGGDAGSDRTGTRTDTVILASIDTKTGDTTLISLPRNTGRMPFPADSPLHEYYPQGFTDGYNGENLEYMLNAMYMNVPANVPPDILGPTDNLPADVLKVSVGEALGQKIDYYVLIELDGFKQLVSALGGVKVNINEWIPLGGDTTAGIPPSKWLPPGPDQHLDGTEALWFARGRYGSSDFQRMDRQRCMIDAIVKQANPANMATRYEGIAKASKDIVQTDLPQELLPDVVNLSMLVKGGKNRSLVFKNGVDGFQSSNPDFALVRQRVAETLDSQGPATPTPDPSATPTKNSSFAPPAPAQQPSAQPTNPFAPPGAEQTPSSEPTPAAPGSPGGSEDLNSTCAFDPQRAADAGQFPPS